jgi:hypothetical protein
METMIGFEVPRFLGFFTVLHTFLGIFRSKNLEKQISQGTDAPVLQVRVLTRIMVHLRLNENETNPNPHVNFITALPMADLRDQDRACQLLRALAAQVKPIMKDHGFVVNSLEEVR